MSYKLKAQEHYENFTVLREHSCLELLDLRGLG